MGFFMSEFWQVFWWMIQFFLIVAYLIILLNIISDLFRDRETGGFVKAVWVFFLLFVPYLTAFLYVIIRGNGMAERSMAAQAQAKSQADSYIREVAGTGPAAEIASAKNLLDSGAITIEEYEALKARALS